ITGLVHDPTNAVISGAIVTVVNERTAEQRDVATNEQGYYSFLALQPSVYTVRVKAEGFALQEVKQLRLAVGQEVHQDFKLAVQATADIVNVEGNVSE